MKQLLLLFMMLFFCISVNADEKDSAKRNEFKAKEDDSKSTSVRARHAPAVIHLLLLIEDTSLNFFIPFLD